ncbi:hypothetical protein IMSHALPRED_005868 [Imshaugia aleurites]|uniref:Schlafen AlbA-2 domain-containing protein n=1 Tax=Imshaugia aleurites TaxID=172621 RepID=A0A8H3J974_9LECA|nr:hypothetical protein IMSHALPRED_005868 [Imshaugia aleurites]
MAVTKAAVDKGTLTQKTPILPRDVCVMIASYQVPFSIFEFASGESVDDVFRRINSGGRKLSRQELRAAGSTGHFSTVVRRIAAKIRGDDSSSDILRLNEMNLISITNKDLAYGLSIDNIFWVANGILTKEQVRESRDEELVGDLVAYMVSDIPPSSRSEFLDDFFGLSGNEEASRKRREDIELAVQRRGTHVVIKDFSRVFDELVYTLSQSNKSFTGLLFDSPVARAPRYFQVVFLAFYTLIVKRNKVPGDKAALFRKMDGSYKSITVAEGGAWGADQRVNAVNAVVGVYESSFVDNNNTDPAAVHWITQLENILGQSYTEQANYDFKQGFLLLDGSHTFDTESFAQILRTCVGIANIRKSTRGYVLVGVADKASTAGRIEQLYGVKVRPYDRFYVTGVEHEAQAIGKNLDQMFQLIVEKIKQSSLSDDLKGHLARNIKSVRYYDLTVYVFDIEAQRDPSHLGGTFYERAGAQLEAVPTTDVVRLVRRYS